MRMSEEIQMNECLVNFHEWVNVVEMVNVGIEFVYYLGRKRK